jgi:SAM-dependent methyltransferase
VPRGRLREFVEDYRRVRLAEGFASTDPTFARGLPFRDATGRNRGAWRLRALHYVVVRAALAALPGVRRVLDLGAGNGWLARRLAGRFQVTAVDLDAGETGLGGLDDARVCRIRGDIEALPLATGGFDAAVAAATIHYAPDLSRALAELARVLRPGGALIVADSPVYPDTAAREAAASRTRAYYDAAGAPRLAERYRGLTRKELDESGLFRFVAIAPGWPSVGASLERLRRQPPSVRLPVLLGTKREAR